MSLVNSMLSGSYSPIYESVIDIDDERLYGGEVCENYLEPHFIDNLVESTVGEIATLQEAILVADVMGEIKVMTEGTNPQPILEGLIQTIGQKIKEFFAKVFNWFKNLFTTASKKQEEEKHNEEVKRLTEKIDQLSDKLNNNIIKDIIDSSTPFEMYPYVDNPVNTITTESEKIVKAYSKYGDDAKIALDKCLTAVRAANKTGKSDRNYNYGGINDVLKDESGVDTFNKWNDSSYDEKMIKASKKMVTNKRDLKSTGDYYKSSTTDSQRKQFDAELAKLEENYEELKNNTTFFGQLDKDESSMSMVEILKYRARGRATSKDSVPFAAALVRVGDIIGVKVPKDSPFTMDILNGFLNFATSPSTKTHKTAIGNAIKMRNTVSKLKQDIDKIIADINKQAKSSAKGIEDLQKLLSKISAQITSVVNSCTQVAQTTIQMATEIRSLAKSVLSRALPMIERDINSDKDSAEELRIRREHDKKFKQNYDSISNANESTSLIESAFMSGLIG